MISISIFLSYDLEQVGLNELIPCCFSFVFNAHYVLHILVVALLIRTLQILRVFLDGSILRLNQTKEKHSILFCAV